MILGMATFSVATLSIQHTAYDTQHMALSKDTQHSDTRHNDNQHSNKNLTLNMMTLSIKKINACYVSLC